MTARSSTDSSLGPLGILFLIVVGILLLLPTFAALFAGPMGMMGPGDPGDGWPIGSTLWSLVVLVVWLALLAAGGYFAYRAMTSGSADERDRALEELRLAYARGDLDREEFQERREELERTR